MPEDKPYHFVSYLMSDIGFCALFLFGFIRCRKNMLTNAYLSNNVHVLTKLLLRYEWNHKFTTGLDYTKLMLRYCTGNLLFTVALVGVVEYTIFSNILGGHKHQVIDFSRQMFKASTFGYYFSVPVKLIIPISLISSLFVVVANRKIIEIL